MKFEKTTRFFKFYEPQQKHLTVYKLRHLFEHNFTKFQVLPFSDSGRSSTPGAATGSTGSVQATLQDNPVSSAEVIVNNANVVVVSTPHTGSANLVETPLIEVSEEENDDNNSKSNSEKSSSTTTLSSTGTIR